MILLSQTAFGVLNWAIIILFVCINAYITVNILKIYGSVLFGKKSGK